MGADSNPKHIIARINYLMGKMRVDNSVSKESFLKLKLGIKELRELQIPPEVIIGTKLVNFIKGVGLKFPNFKKEAELCGRKWQHQVNLWLTGNNLTEKHNLEHPVRNKTIQPVSPQLNGTWKVNQRNSSSDHRLNYHSSSSREYESPDSQEANQRSESISHQSNHHHSFVRKSSSPLQLEKPITQNLHSAEFNANLRIDPSEITGQVKEAPVKSKDRFCVTMGENMFRSVKLEKPIPEETLSLLLSLTTKQILLRMEKHPSFLLEYIQRMKEADQIIEKHLHSAGEKSLARKIGENKDKTYGSNTLPNSHNMPSTSKQGARQSSKSGPESKCHRSKHLEGTQSSVKPKESQEERQTSLDSKNLSSTSQQGAVESSRNCAGSKHDGKRKYIESVQSVANSKELKLEPKPTQDKHLSSISHQVGTESSRSCGGSKHNGKRKYLESTQSVANSKELKLQQKPNEDKHLPSMTHQGGAESSRSCTGSKHDRKRKCIEGSQSVIYSKELKSEQKPTQDKYSHQGGTESSRTCPESKHDRKKAHMENSQNQRNTKEFKEQQFSQDGKLRRISKTELVKSKESKEEQPACDSTLKLDSKQALETKNCDRNYTKKRDSPDQSAMVAITSSKKERTSLYHGGRNQGIQRLKDMCFWNLNKLIKQTSDPTKFINKKAKFETLEPLLVLLSPEKLLKVEEKWQHLKNKTDGVWKLFCDRKFKSVLVLKKETEDWRTFYHRCCKLSDDRLRSIAASVSASASKAKPDRQIKFTTVEGPPTKRQKMDAAKCNGNNVAMKPLPNSCLPSNSRSEASAPPKGVSNHIKPSQKSIKKDAPLMHKAKKTLDQLHRRHRT